jgi:membrane protease subunit HflK
MAREKLGAEEKVKRGTARTIASLTTLVVGLGVLAVWAATGYYELDPGKAAVILRFGQLRTVVTHPGPKLHLPPPIESHHVVDVQEIRREEFGAAVAEEGSKPPGDLGEAAIQTKDNNIVHLEFAVQYRFAEAFDARFRVAEPREMLRDAAQAAVREVVGRTGIDAVIAEGKDAVASESRQLLQRFLDGYEAGIEVTRVQLLEVQPPRQVRDSFDDVIAAAQDRDRKVQEARGYENEVLPQARGQSREMISKASAYKEATVAEAKGETARFLAVLTEYRKAPEVTRQRLYLETMEEVLPHVEKILIEPGTTGGVLPYLPLGGAKPGSTQ